MKPFTFLHSIVAVTLLCCVFSCDRIADKVAESQAEATGNGDKYRQLKEQEAQAGKPLGKPAPNAVRSQLKLLVRPVADPVAPGTRFEATIEVENLPEGVLPMFSGSATVWPERSTGDRTALFSMHAPGGFKPGAQEKTQEFMVKARILMEDGSILELEHKGSFTVRKPEVILTPPPTEVLYAFCGNTIKAEVPGLGELFNPVFSASKAQLIQNPSDKRRFAVIPKDSSTIIEISSLTNGLKFNLTFETYKVAPVPPPQLEIQLAGAKLKPGGKLPKTGAVKVKLIPDAGFQKKLPKDSRYSVQSISLEIIENGKTTPVVKVSGDGKSLQTGIDLPLAKLSSAKSGIKARIVLEGVHRLNFQSDKFEEKGSFVWEGQVK